jgi:hypothetical protein
MTVAEAFEQFKSELELPDREQDKAAAAQKAIREHVSSHLFIADSFLTGSYARFTKITPLNDVDVVFVRNTGRVGLATYGGILPGLALDEVAEAVRKAYPSTAWIQKQSRSVNVQIAGIQFGFDLIPAWLRDPNGFWIPDADTGSWIATDPEGHAQILTEANKQCDNKLKPIIKMAKHWSRNNHDLLRSFHIELICRAIFLNNPITTWRFAVARFLLELSNFVGRPMMDPIYGQSRVDGVLSVKETADLLSRCSYDAQNAIDALDLEAAGKDAEAITKWRSIFVKGFPS